MDTRCAAGLGGSVGSSTGFCVSKSAAPTVLTPTEIKLLLDLPDQRKRTLALVAASTGLRQSELFALKWGDIDFSQGTMNVTRSIALWHRWPVRDGGVAEASARSSDRRIRAMDLRVQKGHRSVPPLHPRMQGGSLRVSLDFDWRPRRDLNPCYRRESRNRLKLKSTIGPNRPFWLPREPLSNPSWSEGANCA